MNNKTLIITKLSRFPHFGEEDSLEFSRGVNVIVGPPNTGKTKWFTILDYLFGKDEDPEELLGEDIYYKYDSAIVAFIIGDEFFEVERRWSGAGQTNKFIVNSEPLSKKDLWNFLMERLEIPIVHYPQGNPYGPRTWPELNWRSLLRHIYRQQKKWTDFADKQWEVEQYACMIQFLGLASALFSDEYRELVNRQKRIAELQFSKDQFVSMLQEVSKEIIDNENLGVALTPSSIDAAIGQIESNLRNVEEQKKEVILDLINSVTGENQEVDTKDLGEHLAHLNLRHENCLNTLRRTQERLNGIEAFRVQISEEQSRMERASEAGDVLADLNITNCPACDQILNREARENECYLCLRPLAHKQSIEISSSRIEFELEQLTSEIKETDDLIFHLSRDIERLNIQRIEIESELRKVQQLLKPTRSAIASILPPEISRIDIEIGSLNEQKEQLLRVRTTLGRREKISDEILSIQATLTALEVQIKQQNRIIDFERSGDLLSDAMNDYLNQIAKINPASWTQEGVKFRIDDRKFDVKVGRSNWDAKLGGTLSLYFLFSYHYALLNLSRYEQCNYPGLVLLDLPAELEDASSIKDKENFVLEPFVNLLSSPGMETCQVIASGSAFEDLEGANRIELTTIWK